MTELERRLSAACFIIVVSLAPPLARRAPAEDPAPPAPADARADTGARPVVVVTGPDDDAYESDVDSAGFTTVIPAAEAWRGYRTVGELLDRSVGIRVTSFGGSEDLATVSVRGSGPAQVRILLDGVTMNLASDAVVNLANLPLDAVERIEVYRGYAPVRFASAGSSSVINIVTRKIDEPTAGGSATLGSFTTGKLTLNGGMPVADGVLSGIFTFRHTDGDFDFVADSTPENPDDGGMETKRVNNDSTSIDMLARYVVPIDGSQLTITNDVFYLDRGTPGAGTQQAKDARLERLRNIFNAAWRSDDDRIGAQFDFTYLDDDVQDPLAPEEGNTDLGLPYERALNRTFALGLRGRGAVPIGERHWVELSGATRFERFLADYPGSSSPGQDEERNTLDLAAGDDIHFARWNLTLSPQLRGALLWNRFSGFFAGFPIDSLDQPKSFDSSVDPRFGVRWDARPWLTLKGSLGTYFRPPTFQELFGSDGFSAPNPTLEPESGFNRDIGFVARSPDRGVLRNLTLEYSYFDNEADDLILLVSTGGRIPRAQNIGKSRIRGHEVRTSFMIGDAFAVEGNYSHQDARDEGNVMDTANRRLPNLPDNVAYTRATLSQPGWSVSYILDYQSEVFLERTENAVRRQPGYLTHDLELMFAVGPPGMRLTVQARNLGDEQYFDQWQFPQPGRAFFATLSYQPRTRDGGSAAVTNDGGMRDA